MPYTAEQDIAEEFRQGLAMPLAKFAAHLAKDIRNPDDRASLERLRAGMRRYVEYVEREYAAEPAA